MEIMQNTGGKKWNVIIRTEGIRHDTLIDAIYSVIAQTYKNKSIILSCHTNNDIVIEDLQKMAEKLRTLIDIKILKADRSKLRGHPLNIALDNTDGEYISFLDDDDIYYPYFGDLLINELENSKKNFAYGVSILIKQKVVNNLNVNTGKEILFFEKFNPIKLLAMNYIPNNTYVFRKEIFGDLRFDEELDLLEDWDYLIQFIFSNKLDPVFIPKEVSEYRRREDNTNSFTYGEIRSEKYISSAKRIGEKYKGKSFNFRYESTFDIYPDQSQTLGLDVNESDIQKLRNEVKEYKEKASELHKELLSYFDKYNILEEKTKSKKWLAKKFLKKVI